MKLENLKDGAYYCYCAYVRIQLFAEGEVMIGEYSPRLRLGEYSPMITEPEANNCFSINTQVIISKKRKKQNISTRNHLHLQWQNDYWQPFCPSR